jgi:hypothetical protein
MNDPQPPPPPPPPPIAKAERRKAGPDMPALSQTEPTWVQRLSDRLNPILVREVNQALNGRAFVITASLALLAITMLALLTASQEEISPSMGRETFSIALMVLAPILLFILPFQAFLSMRAEVRAGTVEHLLMSRLGPSAIVRGKLLAATVQFVIFLAIFSPLIGMTFLLRGIDVPMIATMLTIAFAYALAASALAIACGALCRWPTLFRFIPFAIMLVGLLWLTGMSMALIEGESHELRRYITGDHTGRFFSMVLIPAGIFVVFCSMVGAAVLSHPYENRSTRFRLFAWSWVVISAVWVYVDWNTYSTSTSSGFMRPARLGEMLFFLSGLSAGCLSLFAFFASTEPALLSPRVRVRVPKNRLLALLSAPFLPGAGRGLCFTLLLATLSLATVYVIPFFAGAPAAPPLSEDAPDFALLAWLEVILYCGVAAFVRSCMNAQPSRNWIARATLPLLLTLSGLLPLLLGLVTGDRRGPRWTPLSIFDPSRTFRAFKRNQGDEDILTFALVLAAFLLVLNLPAMVRGVIEVLRASAERRRVLPSPDVESDADASAASNAEAGPAPEVTGAP